MVGACIESFGAWVESVAGDAVVAVDIRNWLQVMGILVVICSVGSNLVGFGFKSSVWCSNGGLCCIFGLI